MFQRIGNGIRLKFRKGIRVFLRNMGEPQVRGKREGVYVGIRW